MLNDIITFSLCLRVNQPLHSSIFNKLLKFHIYFQDSKSLHHHLTTISVGDQFYKSCQILIESTLLVPQDPLLHRLLSSSFLAFLIPLDPLHKH